MSSVVFSADGKWLVAGTTAHITSGNKERVLLWEVATGKQILNLEVFSWVHSVAISADGKTLAAGKFTGFISLWDIMEGK
jgi:WD40 repeat protein